MGHHAEELSVWVSHSLGEEASAPSVGRRAAGASAENSGMCRRDLGQALSWAGETGFGSPTAMLFSQGCLHGKLISLAKCDLLWVKLGITVG